MRKSYTSIASYHCAPPMVIRPRCMAEPPIQHFEDTIGTRDSRRSNKCLGKRRAFAEHLDGGGKSTRSEMPNKDHVFASPRLSACLMEAVEPAVRMGNARAGRDKTCR